MNRRIVSTKADVRVLSFAPAAELPRIPRGRRLRRQLKDYQGDAAWLACTLLLLGWMTLVALTLWH